MPRISAVICTHNRMQYLHKAIAGLQAQALAPDDYEIIVVDNASTDETVEVVEEAAKNTAVTIRYVLEPTLGIARARNRGWREATSSLVAYVDDDAIAQPGWLSQLLRTFESVSPSPACVTGRIDLEWIGGRPSWFPLKYEPLYNKYDLGPVAHWLGENDYLVTCNVAFRRTVLEHCGGFREDLGHFGTQRHRTWGGEDTEIYGRLIKSGVPIYYTPEAVVIHLTPPERQTRRYLLNRLFLNGLGQKAVERITSGKSLKSPILSAIDDLRMMTHFGRALVVAAILAHPSQRDDALFGMVQKAGRLQADIRMLMAGD